MKFKDAGEALKTFKEAAIIHGECTENGNYKLGNKNYKKIAAARNYLKEIGERELLRQFLNDSNLSVRGWAATYLLPLCENEALMVLNDIASTKGVYGGDASTTIQEWRKGNLKSLY